MQWCENLHSSPISTSYGRYLGKKGKNRKERKTHFARLMHRSAEFNEMSMLNNKKISISLNSATILHYILLYIAILFIFLD